MRNNFLEENKVAGDDAHSSFRPEFLHDFIGQNDMVKNIKIFIDATIKRDEALDHVLLYGPPGLGKTTLAHIIANELDAKIHITSGPLLTKPGDLAAILTNLKKKDVLFIDEIHRLNAKIEETLYTAMEDFALDLVIGEGPSARTLRIDVPHFTLIGATTRLGLIASPLRDRFGIPLKLEFYSESELRDLIINASSKLNFAINHEAASEIAKRSRFTPRIALRLLKRLRDFFDLSDIESADEIFIDSMLIQLGIDGLGLDKADHDYINFIAENYFDKPVGIDTIAAALSEHTDNIEESVEPYLIKIGFVNKTHKGRVLTTQALNYWKEKIYKY